MIKSTAVTLGAFGLAIGAYATGFTCAARDAEERLEEQREYCHQAFILSNVTTNVADRAITFALDYQETLDLCLTHLQLTRGYPPVEIYGSPMCTVDRKVKRVKTAYAPTAGGR